MRIRKRQHPLLHGAAFLLTGGMSAPVSAAMMGAKAARNRQADEEMERLTGAAGETPAQRRVSTAARLAELRELHEAGHISDEEYGTLRLQVIAGI